MMLPENEANPNIWVGPLRWGSFAKGRREMEEFRKLSGVRIPSSFSRFLNGIRAMRFIKHSHPKTFNWDWKAKYFNRIAAVNWLIANSGGLSAKYLEIGCASNDLFDSVASLNKVGVDPAVGGTHRMTSDDFFEQNQEIFDVVFIDGLHEYEQVHRDAVNAIKSVRVGGYIAFHDLLPASWKEHHVPRISNSWTGDCWKLALQLLEAKGIEFVILDIDHGVGIIKKISDEWYIPDVSKDLIVSDFSHFVSNVDMLPIRSFDEGINMFAST